MGALLLPSGKVLQRNSRGPLTSAPSEGDLDLRLRLPEAGHCPPPDTLRACGSDKNLRPFAEVLAVPARRNLGGGEGEGGSTHAVSGTAPKDACAINRLLCRLGARAPVAHAETCDW